MRPLAPALTLLLVLAACAPNPATPPPTPGKATPPKATPGSTASPSASPGASPATGPSVGATNVPSVSVSQGPAAASPTAAPTFGPIVAGVRGDGAGRPATAQAWDLVTDLEVADDGTVYVASPYRLRRFTPGGEVALVAGGHRRLVVNLAGRSATTAGFHGIPPLTVALEGGAPRLLADQNRLLRLAADGTLAEVWRGATSEEVWAVVPRADGAVSLVVAAHAGEAAAPTFTWWSARADQAAQVARACTAAEAALLALALPEGAQVYGGLGPRGVGVEDALLLRTSLDEAWRLSPAGGTPTKLSFGNDTPTHLDGRGRFYAVSAGGRVTRLTPGGAAEPLGARLPADFRVTAIASDATGTVHVAGHTPAETSAAQRILRLKRAEAEAIGGLGQLLLTRPEDLVLSGRGLVATGTAELVVADRWRRQILRVRPGQPAVARYGKPGGAVAVAGAKAADVALDPGALALGPGGALYLVHAGASVYRIDDRGILRHVFSLPGNAGMGPEEEIAQIVVAPDGTVYGHSVRGEAGQAAEAVFRVDSQDARTPIPLGEATVLGLALGPDGAPRLALASPGGGERSVRLARWSAADGLEVVDARVRRVSAVGRQALAVDPQGRWWLALGRADSPYPVLARFDPASGQTVELAGGGTDRFAGDTTDDGLGAVSAPVFDAAGDLYWLDGDQIKRLPAASP